MAFRTPPRLSTSLVSEREIVPQQIDAPVSSKGPQIFQEPRECRYSVLMDIAELISCEFREEITRSDYHLASESALEPGTLPIRWLIVLNLLMIFQNGIVQIGPISNLFKEVQRLR